MNGSAVFGYSVPANAGKGRSAEAARDATRHPLKRQHATRSTLQHDNAGQGQHDNRAPLDKLDTAPAPAPAPTEADATRTRTISVSVFLFSGLGMVYVFPL